MNIAFIVGALALILGIRYRLGLMALGTTLLAIPLTLLSLFLTIPDTSSRNTASTPCNTH